MVNNQRTLLLIFFIILVVFVSIMIYAIVSSGFQTVQSVQKILCNEGQCGTDILTGVKRCPDSNERIPIDPSKEVCNSAFLCDNPLTPFALQSDGSTNFNGVCEANTTCPCLRTPQCANYILSVFVATNGDPYQNIFDQRIVFQQQSVFTSLNPLQPPFQSKDLLTFCSVPISWLGFSRPGCNFFYQPEVSYTDVLMCMGGPNKCYGVLNNPCSRGTLAFLSPDSTAVTKEDINKLQVACVRGNPCPCGQVAIFDQNFGNVICKNL